MRHRRFPLFLIALAGLLLPGFGAQWALADLGAESRLPSSDSRQAKVDERTVGAWRATIQEKLYYLHVGTGNIAPQSNWMELALINQGDKQSFYVHHKLGFPSTIGDSCFFNVANTSRTLNQLRGTTPEDLLSAVGKYDIYKYEVAEDHLDVWAADQEFVRESIKAGKIKGSGGTIDDTPDNLIRFIESSGPKLFPNHVRFVRVK